MEIKFTTHYFFCKKNFLQRILSTLLLLFSTSVYSFPSDKVFLQNNIVKVEIEEDKEVTIDEVFDILRKQTKYSFIYRENLFADLKKVSLKKGTIPVNQLLKESLSMKNYRFELIKNNKILVSKVKSKKTEEFQFEVMGNVSDSKGVPLPSASILEKGTTNGVQTDFDGNFIINTSSSNPVLIISYIGFTPKEVSVNGSSTISVVLEESASALDEVLVIGYGSLSNRKVSSAIFSVSADEIKDAKTPTVDQALIGKVPGLQIKQVSGQPGSSSVIRIRGDASITTDNSPLYVIDGFPVNLPYNETQSPLQLLNPNDIESISILKDAASTSIYGSRGSNGVVIIKTKSAKEGKSEISVNYNSMLQTYHPHSKIKVLNGEQFAQYAIDQIEDPMRANGIPIPTDQSHIPEDYRNPKSIGAGTDWFEEITQVAMSNTFDINFSNGNEKSKSFISLGYFNQEGIIKYTEFERITARANLNFKPSEIFSTGVNIAPSLSWGRQAPTGGSTWFAQSVLSSAYQASPIVSPYNEEGSCVPI